MKKLGKWKKTFAIELDREREKKRVKFGCVSVV